MEENCTYRNRVVGRSKCKNHIKKALPVVENEEKRKRANGGEERASPKF